jgi:prepilin-type N-terminal cleavage/methylation domain-containing protein
MKQKGFTLLEILLVVAAIGILAAIVIVAINPNRQLAQVRNAERRSEINSLYKALGQYNIDNNGLYPPEIESLTSDSSVEICSAGVDLATCQSEDFLYLGDLVPTYVSAIPSDEQRTGNGSGYLFEYDTQTGLIRILASQSENSEFIQVGGEFVILEEGLLGYWKFEETTGNQGFDSSENGNTASINNFDFSTQSVEGVRGNAADFDGATNSFLINSTGIGTGDFSISVWINKNSQDFSHDTIASSARFRFGPENGVDYLPKTDFNGGSTGRIEFTQRSFNSWEHLVLVQEGLTTSAYLNGTFVENEILTTSVSINDVEFGRDSLSGIGGVDYFDGIIDELRLYNRALVQDEITTLYNQGNR